MESHLIAEGQGDSASVPRAIGPVRTRCRLVNAVHSDALVASATDWKQILRLYDQLLSMAPSPVVALNRAVALAEVEGPVAALRLVDQLDARELDAYHLFHAIRADLLRRVGRKEEASVAYAAAIARTENARERWFLKRQRDALGSSGQTQGREAAGDRTRSCGGQDLFNVAGLADTADRRAGAVLPSPRRPRSA
jgi:RNA polymerase sigma-70 factor (ECF subfamily)